MRKFLIPAVSAVVLTAAAMPALAQGYGYGGNLEARKAMIDRRIDQGVRNGALDYREAARLRGEFRQILRLEASYRRGGLSGWERADLDRRFDRLSAQIRFERRDRDYGYGRGWDDRPYGAGGGRLPGGYR